MTKPQKQTLAFANKYKWWHSFAADKATVDVVFQLTNKALLAVIFAHTIGAFVLSLPILFIGWLIYGN